MVIEIESFTDDEIQYTALRPIRHVYDQEMSRLFREYCEAAATDPEQSRLDFAAKVKTVKMCLFEASRIVP